jgi:hypothetical protein
LFRKSSQHQSFSGDEEEFIDNDFLTESEIFEADKKSEQLLVSYAEGNTSYKELLNLKDVKTVGE